MIICRTPFRISFFGGGTDYPAWYRQHGGAVIGATIDKYCYLSCRYLPPFFEHSYRIVWSKIEKCRSLDDITHPAAREILRFMDIRRGVEIHYDGDLPARSGMGSSSAFTVGLLHTLHALRGEMIGKAALAAEAIRVEQDLLRETVGSQDQVFAAHGGLNVIRFAPSGDITVTPLTLARERVESLNRHLLMFYTGIERTASTVAATYVQDIDSKQEALRRIGGMVGQALEILQGGDLLELGHLMHAGWQLKRGLSAMVSNAAVDGLYEQARRHGALGGKLTGAGGGGFLLLFAAPERHAAIRAALADRIHVPIRFDYGGSQIIFYDADAMRREQDVAG